MRSGGKLVLVAMMILAENQRIFASDRESNEESRSRQVIVSIPHRRLALIEDGQVIRLFQTAVGASVSPTPAGHFTVVHRISNPTYYAPGKIIGPGRSNPLGTRWIGLSIKGFGIHGTNVPASIGKAASHGCIRMRNSEVEELFELVRIGDTVELHAETDDVVLALFGPIETPVPPTKPQPSQPKSSLVLAVGLAAK